VIGEIHATGIATLVVDRDHRQVTDQSDRLVVQQKGSVVLEGAAQGLRSDARLASFLGV
jgi:branched-chain amino acid transport system ATP-binding protein